MKHSLINKKKRLQDLIECGDRETAGMELPLECIRAVDHAFQIKYKQT